MIRGSGGSHSLSIRVNMSIDSLWMENGKMIPMVALLLSTLSAHQIDCKLCRSVWDMERQRKTVMRPNKPRIKAEDWVKRYQDLLEIVRLVSWCMNRDHLIKTCLEHVSQRLGKRARYLLMEGDELNLHYWVEKNAGPKKQVQV